MKIIPWVAAGIFAVAISMLALQLTAKDQRMLPPDAVEDAL